MSHIANGGGGPWSGTLLAPTDERNNASWYGWNGGDATPYCDDFLWPRSLIFGANASLTGDCTILDGMRPLWDFDSFVNSPRSSVGQRLMSVSGTTRNAAGAVLGGCNVKLFQTGTDIELGTTVSDPILGTFTITSYVDGVTCYLVAYLPGSPDVAGTTVNTLLVS